MSEDSEPLFKRIAYRTDQILELVARADMFDELGDPKTANNLRAHAKLLCNEIKLILEDPSRGRTYTKMPAGIDPLRERRNNHRLRDKEVGSGAPG
jgi:hypothetical protein